VANVANKGFSERLVSAPVSPLGQRLWVKTRYATSVILPSTQAVDPLRTHRPENEEQPISPIYGYVYVTDRYEGLVTVMVGTLLDGDPTDNFFRESDVTRFNPGGALDGASHAFMAGSRLYVACTAGLVVVDISDPTRPRIAGRAPAGFLHNPRKLAVQFLYAFVSDDDGVKVLDLGDPDSPRPLPAATVPLRDARGLYAARTYLYAADGAEGLAIIDIKNPEAAHLAQIYNGGGALDDTRAVQVGAVNASMYALVADGRNGLRVLQMISPENVPGYMGFSPAPNPKLIATYPTRGPALAVSRGLDRDRVVDETGNQTVVFGRRGSRPFNSADFDMFLRRQGQLFRVEDVAVRDGVLETASGRSLAPTAQFVPEAPAPLPEAEGGRLVRRPAD
jgi:LVIVD repeat